MIKVRKITSTAMMPTKGSDRAAGWDLYADLSTPVEVAPGETVNFGTGLAFEIPENTMLGVYSRSGLARKQRMVVSTGVSVIDEDYRGELIVPLTNMGDQKRTVMPYQRIAQIVLHPVMDDFVTEVDELSDTERGTGGFGSTGD